MTILLTKHAPLHAAVETAEAEAEGLSHELEQARATAAALKADAADIEAKVKEARIAVSLGESSSSSVAGLKATLCDQSEEIECADARVIGLQRRLTAASARVETAKQALKEAQWALIEKLAAQRVETMKERAIAFQQDQRELSALNYAAIDDGFDHTEVAKIIPTYFLFTEIVATRGADRRVWPDMGDRRTPRDMITSQIAEVREQLGAL